MRIDKQGISKREGEAIEDVKVTIIALIRDILPEESHLNSVGKGAPNLKPSEARTQLGGPARPQSSGCYRSKQTGSEEKVKVNSKFLSGGASVFLLYQQFGGSTLCHRDLNVLAGSFTLGENSWIFLEQWERESIKSLEGTSQKAMNPRAPKMGSR